MLTEFKLGKNYPSAERNMCHMFKVIKSNIQIAINSAADCFTALKFGT